ncbi:Short-chain dehydrogenase TIC 32 B, chloroplastic [Castilleja foliolosa]|uniref:Short-chain dehydrogenase TIC 32 B, chloroplastic n=1 Tax=Castilleja foliolosa TaxID=1961234 RepID=A0ABD3DTF2_9LAMI
MSVYVERTFSPCIARVKFKIPSESMPKDALFQIVNDELMMDGNPRLNLASFVTTWMEPECDKLIMAALNKNYVDMDEYPVTTELQGGASGIGLETARVLALRNAHVFIAARNMKAANEAKQLILKDHKNARVDVLKLDMASVKSIKAFADNFIALNLPLNILINNAGIMFCPYQLSEDGVDIQLATNHLGHFFLTNLLLDKMKETASSTGIEGRIVNLSSLAHK